MNVYFNQLIYILVTIIIVKVVVKLTLIFT